MKNLCILMFALCLAAGAGAQAKRLCVLGFDNLTGDEVNDNLTRTTSGTLEAAVGMKGSFEVAEAPSRRIGLAAAGLKDFAQESGLDYVLYGTLENAADGSLLLSGGIYDRAGDKTSSFKRSVQNRIDIFEASDGLSLDLLSKLYNEKVRYGSVAILGDRAGRNYEVFVNGVRAGRNLDKVGSVPDGFKDVKLVLASGPDKGKVLAAARVFVEDGKAAPIQLPEPSRPAAEAQAAEAPGKAAAKEKSFRYRLGLGFGQQKGTSGDLAAPSVSFDINLSVDFAKKHSLILAMGGSNSGSESASSGVDGAATPYSETMRLGLGYGGIGYGYIFGLGKDFQFRPALLLTAFSENRFYTLTNTSTSAQTTGYMTRSIVALNPGLELMYNYRNRFSAYAGYKAFIFLNGKAADAADSAYAVPGSSVGLSYAYPGTSFSHQFMLGVRAAIWEIK